MLRPDRFSELLAPRFLRGAHGARANNMRASRTHQVYPSIVAQKNSTTSSFLSLKLYSLAIPFLAPGKKLRRIRPFSWLHGKRLGCSPGFSLHQPKRIQRCEKTWENQRIRWLIIVFHSYLVAIFPMKKA